MEVIAHIETAPAETTVATAPTVTTPVKNGEVPQGNQGENSISTGDALQTYILISSALIIISALVIYFCRKNDKSRSK
ncbi:MAG: hypothetical protein ACI4HM_03180 [Ruminococcus sp.]